MCSSDLSARFRAQTLHVDVEGLGFIPGWAYDEVPGFTAVQGLAAALEAYASGARKSRTPARRAGGPTKRERDAAVEQQHQAPARHPGGNAYPAQVGARPVDEDLAQHHLLIGPV